MQNYRSARHRIRKCSIQREKKKTPCAEPWTSVEFCSTADASGSGWAVLLEYTVPTGSLRILEDSWYKQRSIR